VGNSILLCSYSINHNFHEKDEMTETAAASPPKDTILFSNVTIVRDQEGELSLWVGNEKALGVATINMAQGFASIALPLTRVRLAEDVPATPVETTKNVIDFKKFAKAKLAVDNTTPKETA
jgi:hypothetical protein